MIAANDTKTGDLLPAHDLAGERPAQPSKTARRLAKRGLKAITAQLPAELVDDFHKRRTARGQSVNEAFEHLLRTQYLRKR